VSDRNERLVIPRQRTLEQGRLDFMLATACQRLAFWEVEMKPSETCNGVFTYYTYTVLTPYSIWNEAGWGVKSKRNVCNPPKGANEKEK
jgi:hypothetical protein